MDYLKEHNIDDTLRLMRETLMEMQPSDPYAFMIESMFYIDARFHEHETNLQQVSFHISYFKHETNVFESVLHCHTYLSLHSYSHIKKKKSRQ